MTPRIDAHQHFWRIARGDYAWLTPALGAIYRDFNPDDLAPHLAAHKIAATILVQAAPTDAETAFLLDLADQTAFVAGVVGWTDLAAPGAAAAIAKLAADPLLVGLRPMVQDIDDDDWLARPELAPEARFAEANHANVVSSMRAQLMPNGGTMRIRLDPPQLGALQVTVHMRDGVMTASFETSTDEATRLLSHSLAQLKSVLESQGVSVEKLQVQQGPREMQSTGRNDNQQQEQPGGQQQREASRQEQQEHQRREMMRRMWRRLSGAADPLDVTG